MAFHDDIKSKHLSNFVLVTIGDDIRISTQKITFDEDYYKPILLNIPSISESLDIEQRKYKISSVSLSISDYEVDGERFSDSLNTLMNKEVNIYYASASSKDFTYFGDGLGTTQENADLYKAGTYIVRSFSQDEDKVTLNCEDLSQDKLHRDLPTKEVQDIIQSTDEEQAKKIVPMVFGEVDNSPAIYQKTETEVTDDMILAGVSASAGGSYKVLFDDENTIIPSFVDNDNPLKFYGYDSFYYKVLEFQTNNTDLYTEGNKHKESHHIDLQYTVDGGIVYLTSLISNNILEDNGNNYFARNLVFDELVQCEFSPPIKEFQITELGSYQWGLVQSNVLTGEWNTLGLMQYNADLFAYPRRFSKFDVDILFYRPENVWKDLTWIEIKNDISLSCHSFLPTSFVGNNTQARLKIKKRTHGLIEPDYNFSNVDFPDAYSNPFIDIEHEFTTNNHNTELIDGFKIELSPASTYNTTSNEYDVFNFEMQGNSSSIKYIFNTKFKQNSFYASVIGRAGEAPSSQAIYTEILSELDFNEELIQPSLSGIELGKYAFTINKKINSKKLIEELSQSTPLYPYFKDGEFRIKNIKWKDENGDGYKFSDVFPSKRIKAEDVINYKYDRTKVEKVYTKVNVKYHYDYGLKDFTKETGDVFPDESGDSMSEYTNETFGSGFDQEFVFESKYIRYEGTALNLAKYLAGLHANQHNIINLTLPLNYLTFELGDIVGFDKLIQDRKMFGEDYTKMEVRNGQEILPMFFVNKIKKSLDKVEISLYQLHNFSDNPYSEEEIPEEPETVFGCLNEQAINFNSLANTSQNAGNFGACFFPIEIVPPEIISHGDNHVIPIEINEIIDEPETILSANRVVWIAFWLDGNIRIYFNPNDNLFNENITSLQQGDLINIDFSYEEETDIQEILDLINDSGVHEVYGLTYSSTVNILTLYSNTFTFTGDSSANFNFDANDLNVVISTMPSEPIQEEVNPSLNIIWNRSNNIHEYIPELDLNTINNAYYKVFINSQEGVPIYQSTIIEENEVENFQFNHIINLGQIGLPQNESVQVVVQAINTSMYDNQSIYSNSPTDEFTLVWGEDDGETDTTIIGGDVNLDGNINVVDILTVVQKILGTTELNSEMLLEADMNGDGIINVVDILQLVNKILDQ